MSSAWYNAQVVAAAKASKLEAARKLKEASERKELLAAKAATAAAQKSLIDFRQAQLALVGLSGNVKRGGGARRLLATVEEEEAILFAAAGIEDEQ